MFFTDVDVAIAVAVAIFLRADIQIVYLIYLPRCHKLPLIDAISRWNTDMIYKIMTSSILEFSITDLPFSVCLLSFSLNILLMYISF